MRTFKQFCEAMMGAKPALQVQFGPPGLNFTFEKEFDTGSMSDIHKEQVPAKFVGMMTVPVSELAVRSAKELGMDLGAFFSGIAKGEPSLARFYDEPEHLIALDYAEFDGLRSDVDTIPDSLYEEVLENFWNVVGKGAFKVVQ